MTERIESVTDTTVKPQNTNSGFTLDKAIDNFVGEKTEGNIKYFKNKNSKDISLEFFDYFVNTGARPDLTPSIIDAIKKIKEGGALDDVMSGINDKLLTSVFRETFALEGLYNGVLKLFNNTYDFTPEEQGKVEQALQKEGRGDLGYLQHGDIRRKKFLKSLKLKPKTKEESEQEALVKRIFGEKLDEKLMDDKDFIESLGRFWHGSNLFDIDDFKKILSKVDEEKQLLLIKNFAPRLTLKEAINLGLLNEAGAKKEISEKLDETELSDEQKETFLENVDYSDFFIETSKISNLRNILTNGKIDDLLFKAVREYKESISVSSTGLDFISLDDFKEQALSALIIPDTSKEAFSKLKVGSCFEIKVKQSNGETEIAYFSISQVDEDSEKPLFISNVTSPEGGIIKNLRALSTEESSYEEFFTLLTTISESSGTQEISFYENYDSVKSAGITERVLFENFESGDIQTEEELKKFLDEVDSEGKNVPLNKMAFRFDASSSESNLSYLIDDAVYEVEDVKDGFVYLKGQGPISFSEFALAFKDKECKRFQRIDNDDEFFNQLKAHPNLASGLKDFEYKHGKIVPKGDHHAEEGLKYLVDNDGKAIMLEKLDHTGVNFTSGEYKDGSEEKGEPAVFEGKGKGRNFDYNTLYLYLTSKKFTPIYNKEVHEHEHEHHHHLHSHRGLFKRWFSCMGIAEMVSGSKHVIHAIEHKLKFGNDLKAAKFAKFLGQAMPDGIKYEIQSHVEQEENKSMEAKIKELKGMSTWKMIKEVKHILHTAGPFDPELEAALFAVTGKTGYLYPKGLKEYQGQFLWYQALGGKIGDEIYMKFKKECEEAGRTTFNEEYLVEALLDHQVDTLDKRRNKFNKQYGNVLKEGKKEEEEDGERKTKNKTRATSRYDYIMGEFKNLTYWNGIGAIENLLKKGPDPGHVFGGIPFVILSSGMSEDFVPEMVNKVFGYHLSVPVFSPLGLIVEKNNLELYNNYVARVIELSETKNGKKGKDSEMYKDFKAIQGKSKVRHECIDRADKFWRKYGKDLYPRINMSDGYVLSRKDDEGNESLNAYHEKMVAVHNNDEFKKDYNNDKHVDIGFIDQNNSPIAASGGLITKISIDQNGKLDTPSKKITFMHLDQLEHILGSDEISETKKKELFKIYYSRVERQLSSQYGSRYDGETYKRTSSYQDVKKYLKGTFEVFPGQFINYNTDGNSDKIAYENMLERKWNDYKSGKKAITPTSGLTDKVGKTVHDVVNNNKPKEKSPIIEGHED